MRRLVLIAVLLSSLAAASPALGKEVLSVTACGSDGCDSTKTAGFLRQMTDVGPPTDPPASPAAFYRLNITVGDGNEVAGHDRVSYVPSEGLLLANDGTWLAVRPEIRSGLDELTRGLDALPARRLAGFPADAADAAPPAQAPASAPASTGDDSPIWWILVTGAAALLIGGLLVRAVRTARPSRALHTPD
jgi:hypothetical protein